MPRTHIFISHSSLDDAFVARLAVDLGHKTGYPVWEDSVMRVSDSFPLLIGKALEEARFVLVVISENSSRSDWVQEEIAIAKAAQLARKGVVVVPVVTDDAPIPTMLSGQIYADFRPGYEHGLAKLLRLFDDAPPQLQPQVSVVAPADGVPKATDCISTLTALNDSDLRRRVTRSLSRDELGLLWSDVFGDDMDGQLPGKSLDMCAMEIIKRAERRAVKPKLIQLLCNTYPQVAS